MVCALYSSGIKIQWGEESKVGVKNASYRRTPLQLGYITDLHPEVHCVISRLETSASLTNQGTERRPETPIVGMVWH